MILNIDEESGAIQRHTQKGWADVDPDDLAEWLQRYSSQRARNLGRWEAAGAVIVFAFIAVAFLGMIWGKPVDHGYEAQALPTLQTFGK